MNRNTIPFEVLGSFFLGVRCLPWLQPYALNAAACSSLRCQSLVGLNRILLLSALQSAPCEGVFTQTAHVLFLSFALPFGMGFAHKANTKASWFLIVRGAMLTQFLVLILLVFAVTCESH